MKFGMAFVSIIFFNLKNDRKKSKYFFFKFFKFWENGTNS